MEENASSHSFMAQEGAKAVKNTTSARGTIQMGTRPCVVRGGAPVNAEMGVIFQVKHSLSSNGNACELWNFIWQRADFKIYTRDRPR